MATYKLIQDIEAEDHILGPLSLRQFIYALLAAFLYYICFFLITRGGAFFLILFLPPALFFTFFAFPFGKDQSTEVWALAKLRFYFKPRRRIWDQSGIKELVTINVPKKIERPLTNGLDQTQVRSRLNALANTLDSRGWAIKNINVNAYSHPNPMMAANSDRLIEASSLPRDVPNVDVTASDDILDEHTSPIAQQFQQMINQSEQQHRQQLMTQMNAPAPGPSQVSTGQASATPPADYWFMNQAAGATSTAPTYQPHIDAIHAQDATPEEEALAAQMRAKSQQKDVYQSHLRTLQPIRAQQSDNTQPATDLQVGGSTPPVTQADTAMTAQPDPAILNLASNNDLNVATLAREAHKAKGEEPPEGEVVISLH